MTPSKPHSGDFNGSANQAIAHKLARPRKGEPTNAKVDRRVSLPFSMLDMPRSSHEQAPRDAIPHPADIRLIRR